MKLVFDFLLITGIIFTCFILFLLIRKNDREPSHKVLAAIFVFVLLVFLNYYAYLHKIRVLFYLTEVFADSIDVFIGPLFLMYIKGITGENLRSWNVNFVHFVLPFIYLFAISIPDTFDSILIDFDPIYLESVQYVFYFTTPYSFCYVVFALIKLIKFQHLVKYNYSNLENRDLTWAKYFLIGAIIILAIDIISILLGAVSLDIGNDDGFMTVIPIVFLVGYLGYYGIVQSKILLPDFLRQTSEIYTGPLSDDNALTAQKYLYDTAEMKQLSLELKALMVKSKPYLNEDLTLAALAELLGVSDKKLSTVLNQNMGASFYDYVNDYRINEVKKRMSLPESDKYTLLAIAYDSGFKSKSSFNRIFKKRTQLSPSQYKKRLASRAK